jgi:hypothetical protein
MPKIYSVLLLLLALVQGPLAQVLTRQANTNQPVAFIFRVKILLTGAGLTYFLLPITCFCSASKKVVR